MPQPIATYLHSTSTILAHAFPACFIATYALVFYFFYHEQIAKLHSRQAKNVPYMDYIKEYKIESNLAKFGKGVQTFFDTDGWANDRIIELFQWYASGQYGDLLEEFMD